MNFRFARNTPVFPPYLLANVYNRRRFLSWHVRQVRTMSQARASHGGGNSNSQGNAFVMSGATVATLLMLGALHARRLYDDKKLEEAREKGIEFEFREDVKATFLRMLPLRSISRVWGFLMSVDIPVWLRPHVYKAWARAFHSNLQEAALPLEEYASLRDFFIRTLREGCRPIDPNPYSLVSPVDGTILRFGKLNGTGTMIEQVKGFSYSVSSLLGSSPLLSMVAEKDTEDESSNTEQESTRIEKSRKSWWWVSLASPKVRETISECPLKGLYYCVIYLKPGDYHRIHSPVDWNVLVRRHFSGRLFPVNERAARTMRNLYVENERVVLEGEWQQGFMALAAIGATNIGSIELFIESELRTNRPRKMLLPSEPPEERLYEPEGVGVMLKKGDEVAAFNMGSTVVVVFQAPTSKSDDASEFQFSIRRGDKIRVGEALGVWHNESVTSPLVAN
ncbi:phosphatidylserine decarboxylase proenzyme 1, mitochondrial-like [Hibiscus syriacus]|uniref:phosphatidylserine decarboxylase proenzyme 1, mitochondrial-like n=1 Tax=Hibiscus syriacus TaxID=106335 RepID=UPI0019216C2F|nr:phosphatidylserine decarboxylase proenzyme 1, mitochondrial-like [Hibiscus syriacus]